MTMVSREDDKPKTLVDLERAWVVAGGQPILQDITWRLDAGESWAVLGGNGAGKSTFLKLVRGDIWPAAGHGKRTYLVDGIPRETPIGFKETTAWVSPDLLLNYQRIKAGLTGLELVLTGLYGTPLLYQKPTPDQEDQARTLLDQLGLFALAGREMHQTSQGQAMRLIIARALMGGPKVLFLDECCHGLDTDSRRQVLKLLERLLADGRQFLYTTHRPDEMVTGLGRVLSLREGRMDCCGPLARVMCQQAVRNAGRAGGRLCLGPSPARRRPAPEYIFRVKRADVAIEGKRVLFGLDWEVKPGEHWAVIGGNGAGKTTLLNLLAGDLHPVWGGSIGRFGSAATMELSAIRRRLGYVAGRLHAAFFRRQTVLETVAAGLLGETGLVCHTAGPEELAKANAALALVGISNLAERDIHTLSAGQLRKAMIARAMAGEPVALLLDEPLRGLDQEARREINSLFEQLAQNGTTLIYVSHHLDEWPQAINQVLKLKQGRAVFCGTRAEFSRLNAA